ncbi:MAG TPA: permease-like cell division protein FtsX [Nocardioidaceae bacterium]|nr:permease-like cell division protein FtsX [Nocardioidaceae bacterium]
MQLTYVFSELGNGLRRNISMTVAVITTIFVSLTLVGLGLLLNKQADLIEKYWGDRLQITVFMCAPSSPEANCIEGKANDAQKASVVAVLDGNAEVKNYRFETSEEAFSKFRSLYENKEGETSRAVLESVSATDFPESYWVTLKDPQKFQGVKSEVLGLKGVSEVRDLRDVLKPLYTIISGLQFGAIGVAAFLVIAAILQVGNTIRLAALARRREIGIMRLVGASSWYIQLPFLLEALFAALIGVAIASLAIVGFMAVVIYGVLGDSTIVPWVGWGDSVGVMMVIGMLGVAMTLVPTLLLTRKYLQV